MEPSIELSKTRDFGEIISDSFLFIRQNIKPLLSSFFIFCGFFLLVTIVTSIAQQIKIAEIFNNSEDGVITAQNGFWSNFGLETVLSSIFGLLTFAAMHVSVICFMTLYKEKGNVAPTNEEVWGYFKYYYFKIFGSSLLNIVIFIIGFVLCIIPGIYLYPILGLMFPIMMVENTSYAYAFNQSFRLIKDNWWTVFGALFITGLIISICSSVVTIPFQAVNVWSMYLKNFKTVHLSILSIIIGGIVRGVAMVLYILPLVALTICYFSLTETKDSTGLMSRINQLGNTSPDTNAPAEEY